MKKTKAERRARKAAAIGLHEADLMLRAKGLPPKIRHAMLTLAVANLAREQRGLPPHPWDYLTVLREYRW